MRKFNYLKKKIRIFNLNAGNRKAIRKNVDDFGQQRLVTLQAGYGNNLGTIFSGTVTTSVSYREGNNFISEIDSLDGGFAYVNCNSNHTLPPGTPLYGVIATLISDLSGYGVTLGAIGTSFNSISKTSQSYVGNTIRLLKQICGNVYIDNGKVYCLGNTECAPALPYVITDVSGLLGTPMYENTILKIDMLFNPYIVVGMQVVVLSTTYSDINGTWKVVGCNHRGTISPAVSGDAITTLNLMKPQGLGVFTFGLGPVNPLSGNYA
jgi:hypothetical protein